MIQLELEVLRVAICGRAAIFSLTGEWACTVISGFFMMTGGNRPSLGRRPRSLVSYLILFAPAPCHLESGESNGGEVVRKKGGHEVEDRLKCALHTISGCFVRRGGVVVVETRAYESARS